MLGSTSAIVDCSTFCSADRRPYYAEASQTQRQLRFREVTDKDIIEFTKLKLLQADLDLLILQSSGRTNSTKYKTSIIPHLKHSSTIFSMQREYLFQEDSGACQTQEEKQTFPQDVLWDRAAEKLSCLPSLSQRHQNMQKQKSLLQEEKERRQRGEQHDPFVILTFSPCYRQEDSYRHWLRKERRSTDVKSKIVTTPATAERTQHIPLSLQLDTNEEAFCSSAPMCQMD